MRTRVSGRPAGRSSRTRNGRITTVALVLLVGTGGGLGYAWWTATGTGAGAAGTGTHTPWDIEVDPAAGGPLTPGGATQTVDFTVTNAGSGHQKLNSVTVAVANSNGSAWTAVAGCSAADYSVSITSAPTYDDVAPGDTRAGTATVEMVNAAGNQNACKDAVVPLYFAAS
jgi:hypothetical protein